MGADAVFWITPSGTRFAERPRDGLLPGVLDDESGPVQKLVVGQNVGMADIAAVKLEGAILFLVEAVVCVELLQAADNEE